MEITEGTLAIDGAEIVYEIRGDTPWLVLVHGGLLHMGSWDDQLDAFGNRRGLLRYDQRGFFRSTVGERKPYRHVDDLVALLDHIGIATAIILGLSQGGRIAIELALEAPERVEALILSGPGLHGFEWSAELGTSFEEIGAAFEDDEELGLELLHRLWTDGPSRAQGAAEPAARERLKKLSREAFSGTDVDDDEQPIVPTPLERLAEISVPILLIEGEDDVEDILRIGDLIEQKAADVERHRIRDTAHHPNVERPEEFNSIVLEWLEKKHLV